jgi:hypothetical protein
MLKFLQNGTVTESSSAACRCSEEELSTLCSVGEESTVEENNAGKQVEEDNGGNGLVLECSLARALVGDSNSMQQDASGRGSAAIVKKRERLPCGARPNKNNNLKFNSIQTLSSKGQNF